MTFIHSIISSAQNMGREFSELERLFLSENKDTRKLVFYAESGIFYRYYEDYIEEILKNSDLDICYISSEPNDAIFTTNETRIKPFYIKNVLTAAFARLDSRALVIATPDLGRGVIKRAPEPVHHVYAFRGVSSTHLAYRLGAFDNYDSILCTGDYQIDEIRKTEELYGLKRKELVLTGYPLLERTYRQHQEYRRDNAESNQTGRKAICLIAPTWSPVFRPASILDSCIEELIEALAPTDFEVWIRPHPEYLKRFPDRLKSISKALAKTNNISLQTQLASMECLHRADVLITDHSAIAMDFVLGTERPVLFIDTALREDNPEWTRLKLDPVEITYREKMGARLALNRVKEAPSVLNSLMLNRDNFRATLPDLRDKLVANWQRAARVGAEHIIKLCR